MSYPTTTSIATAERWRASSEDPLGSLPPPRPPGPRDPRAWPRRRPVARRRRKPLLRPLLARHRPQPRRPFHHRGRQLHPPPRVLVRRHGRRGVEDHGRWHHLDAHRRRMARQLVGGRAGGGALRPGRGVGGDGRGELRGNVMQGDGVYRTTDGGATWTHVGLEDTQASRRASASIPRTRTWSCVAALGHPFGTNAERGVFRTRDGGRTWTKVLFRDERTGAVDLALDPADPDVLYATLVGGVPPAVEAVERRAGVGHLQVDGRRRHLDGADPQPGLPHGRAGQDHRHGGGRDSRTV